MESNYFFVHWSLASVLWGELSEHCLNYGQYESHGLHSAGGGADDHEQHTLFLEHVYVRIVSLHTDPG